MSCSFSCAVFSGLQSYYPFLCRSSLLLSRNEEHRSTAYSRAEKASHYNECSPSDCARRHRCSTVDEQCDCDWAAQPSYWGSIQVDGDLRPRIDLYQWCSTSDVALSRASTDSRGQIKRLGFVSQRRNLATWSSMDFRQGLGKQRCRL